MSWPPRRDDLRAVLAHRAPWIREVHMTADSEVHVADVTQALVCTLRRIGKST